MTNKPAQGGPRRSAGRPCELDDPWHIHVTLDAECRAIIARQKKSRSQYIRELIKAKKGKK